MSMSISTAKKAKRTKIVDKKQGVVVAKQLEWLA